MERKPMIKILEILEKAYDRSVSVDNLMKKTGLKDIDGEISQIIKYLKNTNKVLVELVPESRMGLKTKRDSLHEWLQKIDEITITPEGIDFLNNLKRLETDKKRNYLILDTTIVLTQIAIIGIALTIYEKFGLDFSNPAIRVPWALSVVIWIVLIAFFLLLLYRVLNIIFNKESWGGILFYRD